MSAPRQRTSTYDELIAAVEFAGTTPDLVIVILSLAGRSMARAERTITSPKIAEAFLVGSRPEHVKW